MIDAHGMWFVGPTPPRPDLPYIALRKDDPNDESRLSKLDDVVVTRVTMFRAEMMDEHGAWMACYLDNGTAVDFYVRATKKGKLILTCTDQPKPGEAVFE